MRCTSTTIVYVSDTPAAIKDELLSFNGAYDLDDAVQIDIVDLNEHLEAGTLTFEAADYVTKAIKTREGSVYQFV